MSTDYDRAYEEMTMDCDGDDGTGLCVESLQLSGPFQDCIAQAKTEGWSMRPDDDGGWKHYCPGCTKRNMEWN